MSVPETMPDRQYRRGALRPGVHRRAAPSGRAASGTRNQGLQGTVRDAVGDRVDRQRREEPAGAGQASGSRSGDRVSRGLAQAGWLERAASRSLEEAPRSGRSSLCVRHVPLLPVVVRAHLRASGVGASTVQYPGGMERRHAGIDCRDQRRSSIPTRCASCCARSPTWD